MGKIESYWRSRNERPKNGEEILVYRQVLLCSKIFDELRAYCYFNSVGWADMEAGFAKSKVIAWLPMSELNLPETE